MNGKVSVRYMVDDVDQAIDFYTNHFGFEPGHNASPAFAAFERDLLDDVIPTKGLPCADTS